MSAAVLVGVLAGFSWVLQAVVLTVLTSALAADSIRRAERGSLVEDEEPLPRSRVAHYAQIARVKDSARLVQTAINPFERLLLGSPSWPGMSPEQLAALRRRVTEEDEQVATGPEPAWR